MHQLNLKLNWQEPCALWILQLLFGQAADVQKKDNLYKEECHLGTGHHLVYKWIVMIVTTHNTFKGSWSIQPLSLTLEIQEFYPLWDNKIKDTVCIYIIYWYYYCYYYYILLLLLLLMILWGFASEWRCWTKHSLHRSRTESTLRGMLKAALFWIFALCSTSKPCIPQQMLVSFDLLYQVTSARGQGALLKVSPVHINYCCLSIEPDFLQTVFGCFWRSKISS